MFACFSAIEASFIKNTAFALDNQYGQYAEDAARLACHIGQSSG